MYAAHWYRIPTCKMYKQTMVGRFRLSVKYGGAIVALLNAQGTAYICTTEEKPCKLTHQRLNKMAITLQMILSIWFSKTSLYFNCPGPCRERSLTYCYITVHKTELDFDLNDFVNLLHDLWLHANYLLLHAGCEPGVLLYFFLLVHFCRLGTASSGIYWLLAEGRLTLVKGLILYQPILKLTDYWCFSVFICLCSVYEGHQPGAVHWVVYWYVYRRNVHGWCHMGWWSW